MGKHSFKSSEADGLDPNTDSLHRLLAEEEARELVRRTRQYDERALTRIYNLFADRVFRFIYYRVQDRPHAEDLTNEVFVRLLESISDFRASGDDAALLLTGWIFTIARNIVIDFYRRQRTHSADSLSDTAEEIPDTFDSDFHLTRADLQLALAKLT
ncbi:MAG TPA: sigma-70 family RNA polymerase sigma factor, partial [Anaerolineae bacterium]|nr:sigma-70 family RNA polymerase sigma factor [Anaerolineae bacterium]